MMQAKRLAVECALGHLGEGHRLGYGSNGIRVVQVAGEFLNVQHGLSISTAWIGCCSMSFISSLLHFSGSRSQRRMIGRSTPGIAMSCSAAGRVHFVVFS